MLETIGTVSTYLLGPAGILLGWWLNQRSTRGAAARAEERADEAEERHRVLEALGLGRDVTGYIRSLLHGITIKQQYRQAPTGLQDMMN